MNRIKLIIGLGNPGKTYDATRHNTGFTVIDAFAHGYDHTWKKWLSLAQIAYILKEHKVILVKPLTYMNNSGEAVRKVSEYFGIAPQELLVVSDDFSLPLGKLRFRSTGSSGGHNGLASIIEHLNTKDFPRLRLGIGPAPAGVDPAEFVLNRFSAAEKKPVQGMVVQAVSMIEKIITEGVERASSQQPSL